MSGRISGFVGRWSSSITLCTWYCSLSSNLMQNGDGIFFLTTFTLPTQDLMLLFFSFEKKALFCILFFFYIRESPGQLTRTSTNLMTLQYFGVNHRRYFLEKEKEHLLLFWPRNIVCFPWKQWKVVLFPKIGSNKKTSGLIFLLKMYLTLYLYS